jgi:hypothetical protein
MGASRPNPDAEIRLLQVDELEIMGHEILLDDIRRLSRGTLKRAEVEATMEWIRTRQDAMAQRRQTKKPPSHKSARGNGANGKAKRAANATVPQQGDPKPDNSHAEPKRGIVSRAMKLFLTVASFISAFEAFRHLIG